MGIEENIKRIFEEVTKINKDVEIVAATKTRTIEEIRTCINTGLKLFYNSEIEKFSNIIDQLAQNNGESYDFTFKYTSNANKVPPNISVIILTFSILFTSIISIIKYSFYFNLY